MVNVHFRTRTRRPDPDVADLCDAHVFGEIAVAIVVAVLNVECERIVRAVGGEPTADMAVAPPQENSMDGTVLHPPPMSKRSTGTLPLAPELVAAVNFAPGFVVPIPTLPLLLTYRLGVVVCVDKLTVNVPETCRAAVGVMVAMPTRPPCVIRMRSTDVPVPNVVPLVSTLVTLGGCQVPKWSRSATRTRGSRCYRSTLGA